MKELAPLIEACKPAVAGGKKSRSNYVAEVRDPKTGQTLRVLADEPLEAFCLDPAGGKTQPQGVKAPDAVLVGETASGGFVIFIDLTQSMRPRDKGGSGPIDPAPRKLEQLRAGIDHFHPTGRGGGARSHGDEHHDAWSTNDRLPIKVEATHRVGGLGIGFHHTARTAPILEKLGEKKVVRALWSPVPSRRGYAEVALKDLFRNLGWKL